MRFGVVFWVGEAKRYSRQGPSIFTGSGGDGPFAPGVDAACRRVDDVTSCWWLESLIVNECQSKLIPRISQWCVISSSPPLFQSRTCLYPFLFLEPSPNSSRALECCKLSPAIKKHVDAFWIITFHGITHMHVDVADCFLQVLTAA